MIGAKDVELLEDLGWEVALGDAFDPQSEDVELSMATPAGEDWHVWLGQCADSDELEAAAMRVWENFSVEDEFDILREEEGCGAPYRAVELLADQYWKAERLDRLLTALQGGEYDASRSDWAMISALLSKAAGIG